MHVAYLHSRPGDLNVGSLAFNAFRPRHECDSLHSFAKVTCIGVDGLAASDPGYHKSMLAAGAANWLPAAHVLKRGIRFDAIFAESEWLGIPAILFGLANGDSTPVYVFSDGLILEFEETLACLRGLDTARFLCPSRGIREALVSEAGLPASHVSAVGHSVDCEFFAPAAAESPSPLFLCVDCETIDLETVISAFQNIPVRLVLVRRSSTALSARRLQNRSMPTNCEIVGCHKWSTLRTLYAAAAAVIVPLREGRRADACEVVAQAMAMGRPVVTTRTRANGDLVEDGVTGFHVQPNAPDQIRNRVEQLLGDRGLREHMGRSARDRAVSLFDHQKHGALLQAAFMQHLSSGVDRVSQ